MRNYYLFVGETLELFEANSINRFGVIHRISRNSYRWRSCGKHGRSSSFGGAFGQVVLARKQRLMRESKYYDPPRGMLVPWDGTTSITVPPFETYVRN